MGLKCEPIQYSGMQPSGKTLIDQLQPIETRRTDPASGIEFVFHSAPPIGLVANKRFSELTSENGLTTKEFFIYFLWEVVIGRWDLAADETIRDQAKAVLPLLKEVITSIDVSLDSPLTFPDGGPFFRYELSHDLGIMGLTSSNTNEPIPDDFLLDLVIEVRFSEILDLAMAWYSTIIQERVGENPKKASHKDEPPEPEGKSKRKVFSASKQLKPNQFAMPHEIGTSISRVIQQFDRADAIAQYENLNRDRHYRTPEKTSIKISHKGKKDESEFSLAPGNPLYPLPKKPKKRDEIEFVVEPGKREITAAERFADRLMSLKDAKVLQTFFGLVKWVNNKDTSLFKDVPVSEIMSLVLKSSESNKFNKRQRQEFSEVLDLLSSLTITISVIGEQRNMRTGKGKPALQEERGVKLFRMIPVYSLKQEFQSLPEEQQLDHLHFDKTVITRFSGEFLPGYPGLFTQRSNIYFDSLLELDAGRDATAIVLGFYLQTRFNQMGFYPQTKDESSEEPKPDKAIKGKSERVRYVELDRAFLINLCEYQKTNQTKPSQATKQLAKTLDKLKASKIITKYEGLTNNDADKVRIYPPLFNEPKALSS